MCARKFTQEHATGLDRLILIWLYCYCALPHRTHETSSRADPWRRAALALIPILLSAIFTEPGPAGFFFSNANGRWEFRAF